MNDVELCSVGEPRFEFATIKDAHPEDSAMPQTISDLANTTDSPHWRVDSRAAAEVTHEGTSLGQTGRRLLLIEDNGDLRHYLAGFLQRNGWTVTAVPDAESALRQQEIPDIILTDIMLPGRDGLSLLRMIRANPYLTSVPVVLMTGRTGAESAADALRAGADDFILKPCNVDELLVRLDVHHELTRHRNDALAKAENQVTNLEAALSSNRRIGAAIGVLMASRQVTSQEAFALLRKASNESNRKLHDVADRVVLTGSLDFVVGRLHPRSGAPARSRGPTGKPRT